jgi:hypothetical protein
VKKRSALSLQLSAFLSNAAASGAHPKRQHSDYLHGRMGKAVRGKVGWFSCGFRPAWDDAPGGFLLRNADFGLRI